MKLTARRAALLIGVIGLCWAAACSQPAGGGGGVSPDRRYTLDPKLLGEWKFVWANDESNGVERVTVTDAKNKSGSFGTFEYDGGFGDGANGDDGDGGGDGSYAGDIMWVERFSDSAGILIVEFWPGREVSWMSLDDGGGWQPHPEGYRFYGVYYINYTGNGGPGSTCFFANTNDQDPNAQWGQYGPTETATLEQAKAQFTQGNMNQLLDLSVGDPQTKQ